MQVSSPSTSSTFVARHESWENTGKASMSHDQNSTDQLRPQFYKMSAYSAPPDFSFQNNQFALFRSGGFFGTEALRRGHQRQSQRQSVMKRFHLRWYRKADKIYPMGRITQRRTSNGTDPCGKEPQDSLLRTHRRRRKPVIHTLSPLQEPTNWTDSLVLLKKMCQNENSFGNVNVGSTIGDSGM